LWFVPGLLQLRVLRFGLFEDGNIRIRVFPKRAEILISAARLCAIACECVGAGQSQVRERVEGTNGT
jgi:hypothetical protein